MKNLKKALAVLLTLVLVSGSFMCFALDSEKQYFDYDKVLLLGDSQASGHTDYNYKNTEFIRIDDSYCAYVADDLGAELIPFACPGFRTIELRYMLDDNYRPDDKYLFSANLEDPPERIVARIPAMQQAVKDADVIIVCIGGNDWGGYLGWVFEDVQLENQLPDDVKNAIVEYLKNAKIGDDIIENIIKIGDTFNAADELLKAIPEAIEYCFRVMEENWKAIVEIIYENNPDVTLVAVGLFSGYLKTQEGVPDVVAQPNDLAMLVEDGIIANGNKFMVKYQPEYGYIYVAPRNVIVETAHPTPAGHRQIADAILNALPDKRFQYTEDVTLRNPAFTAIEYLTINGYMTGTSDTTFSPDDALTEEAFSKAINKIDSNYKVSDSDKKVSKLKIIYNLYKITDKSDFFDFIDILNFSIRVLVKCDNDISRDEFAGILYYYIQNFVK
jgi:lysophospholipase L1-like esterase